MKDFLFDHYRNQAAPELEEVLEKNIEHDKLKIKSAGVSPKEKPTKHGKCTNHVRRIRESLLMSKAELARKAGLSVLTVGRIENGVDCRMDTKRKVILALGLSLEDKAKVFPEELV